MNKRLRFCLSLIMFASIVFLLPQLQAAREVKPADRFAKLDTIKVHYQNFGQGKEALVFVHGWTCNLTFWKANIPAFIDQTRVIAIDLPGHGESDKPQVAYSMDLFARAINAVLGDAKVEHATLVGHSMGAPVIRQFYRKYPAKARALVIVDGGLKPMGTTESMKQFLDPFRGLNYKEHAGRMIDFMTSAMKDREARVDVKTAMLSAPQHVMVSAFESMLDPEIWKEQDKIQVPTLALMAANQMWDKEYEEYVRDLVPGIEFQVWPGVSHFLMMDEPQKFNEAIMSFLKKNRLVK